MADANSASRLSIWRVVLVPTVLTLAITLLRLAGELRGWPRPWFDPDRGIVGITWLPPIFGIYFAWMLWHAGQRPERITRAFALGLLGCLLNEVVEATVFRYAPISIFSALLILWGVAVVSAFLQYLAWPALFRTLIVYGFGARIPTVIITYLALRGHWGTHFDYRPGPQTLGFWPRFLWFGLFEELIYWVSFTVATGSLTGSLAAAVAKRRHAGLQKGKVVTSAGMPEASTSFVPGSATSRRR
jgi:hypothetical protein